MKILDAIDRLLEQEWIRGTYNFLTSTISFLIMPTPTHNSRRSWLVDSLQLIAMGQQPLFIVVETRRMWVTTGKSKLFSIGSNKY